MRRGATAVSYRTFALCAAWFFLTSTSALAQAAEGEQEGDSSVRRIEWFWNQRSYPHGSVPQWIRVQAIHELKRQEAGRARVAGGSPALTWVSIGPGPVDDENGHLFAGRVWSLAVDPRNPAVVFAG